MKVNSSKFVIIALCFFNIEFSQCILPLIPVAVGGIASGLAGLGYYVSKCHFAECCSDEYIPADFSLLDSLLKSKLYGQHLAHETVLYALKGHFKVKKSLKALAFSFHGSPGTGKNYLANMIVEAIYKKGFESKFVHFYSGRLDFPSNEKVSEYQRKIQEEVTNHLKLCPRSVFIFDEVEKIPEGTLNVLVPFLNYHSQIPNVDTTQAIFIFLSNYGERSIVSEMTQMWQNGKKREETRLNDFETLLAIDAFRSPGGFHECDTIDTSLIDHYIPFLPLEEIHVKKCILDAFRRRSINPTKEMAEEALEFVTFWEPPHNIYSNAGCKRLDAKVSAIIEAHDIESPENDKS